MAGDSKAQIGHPGRVSERIIAITGGDAGYFDRQGRLWLLGRCAQRVSDDAGELYPFAVEAAASDVPGVARSAFVRHRGRRLLIVETDRALPSPRQQLMSRLAWAHLSDVKIVDHIPVDKRHNSKVDYPALRELLGSRQRREVS